MTYPRRLPPCSLKDAVLLEDKRLEDEEVEEDEDVPIVIQDGATYPPSLITPMMVDK